MQELQEIGAQEVTLTDYGAVLATTNRASMLGLLIAAGWSPIAANHAADAVGAHHGFRATRAHWR